MPRRSWRDYENEARALRGEPPLPPPQPRKKQKNPRKGKLALVAAPPETVSPVTHASPSNATPLALPDDSPSIGASPSTRDSPKPVQPSVEATYRKGDSRINHDFFDGRLCGLDPLAQLLYFHLNRYREGSSNLTVILSWSRLAARIPVSESTLRRAFSRLSAAGLAFKERDVYGKAGAQGIVFRVVTGASPSSHASPSTADTHKRTDLISNNKSVSPPAFQNCPDCSGSGFYYPKGYEGGVKKCSHPKLA